MTPDDALCGSPARTLAAAEEPGSVRAAWRVMDIHPSTFLSLAPDLVPAHGLRAILGLGDLMTEVADHLGELRAHRGGVVDYEDAQHMLSSRLVRARTRYVQM